jgi:hypothetical protein
LSLSHFLSVFLFQRENENRELNVVICAVVGWGRIFGGCVSCVVRVNIPSLCIANERRETAPALNKAGKNYPHRETEEEGDFIIERI